MWKLVVISVAVLTSHGDYATIQTEKPLEFDSVDGCINARDRIDDWIAGKGELGIIIFRHCYKEPKK